MSSLLGNLDTDSFELKRVMRQEAHEKAFEIKVQTQRLFEKEKQKIVQEGQNRVDNEFETKKRNIVQDLNIKRSSIINKTRMDLMNVRNGLMESLVQDTLKKIESEVALPDNEQYHQVCKQLIIQGCIKLLEPKVLVKCREKDLSFMKDIAQEAQDDYNKLMQEQTKTDNYTTEVVVLEDSFIDADSIDGKCGGVIMMNEEQTIVCSNTLENRLHLCYEESLPTLRHDLFPTKA